MDGWWREVFDGDNGFSIGGDEHSENIEKQDQIDSQNLFRVLSEEVIPTFYNRDASGIPRAWIKKMREKRKPITRAILRYLLIGMKRSVS